MRQVFMRHYKLEMEGSLTLVCFFLVYFSTRSAKQSNQVLVQSQEQALNEGPSFELQDRINDSLNPAAKLEAATRKRCF
jgi:hypothetical protein